MVNVQEDPDAADPFAGGGRPDAVRVLVIAPRRDDYELVRHLLRHAPGDGGYRPTRARTIGHGLDRLAAEPVDVVLVDAEHAAEAEATDVTDLVTRTGEAVPIIALTTPADGSAAAGLDAEASVPKHELSALRLAAVIGDSLRDR